MGFNSSRVFALSTGVELMSAIIDVARVCIFLFLIIAVHFPKVKFLDYYRHGVLLKFSLIPVAERVFNKFCLVVHLYLL